MCLPTRSAPTPTSLGSPSTLFEKLPVHRLYGPTKPIGFTCWRVCPFCYHTLFICFVIITLCALSSFICFIINSYLVSMQHHKTHTSVKSLALVLKLIAFRLDFLILILFSLLRAIMWIKINEEKYFYYYFLLTLVFEICMNLCFY